MWNPYSISLVMCAATTCIVVLILAVAIYKGIGREE